MHKIINQLILEESLDGREPVRVQEETSSTEMAVTVGDFFFRKKNKNNFTRLFWLVLIIFNLVSHLNVWNALTGRYLVR